IRLADRIAIMRDGAVVQIGTPEELVMHPASDYVREFTRNVPRAKVLSVGAVMRPARPEFQPSAKVRDSDKIEGIAAAMIGGDGDAAVIASSGNMVGLLARQTVLNVLTNRI